MSVIETIDLAEFHVVEVAQGRNKICTMLSSARLCLEEAREFCKCNQFEAARLRAIRSLSYTVGVYHSDYIAANRRDNCFKNGDNALRLTF